MGSIMDMETGEIVNDKFVKLYIKSVALMSSMTQTEAKIFYVLIRDCKYGNQINLTPKRKKIYVKEIGISSQNSFNTMLKRLENKNIIQRDEGSTLYNINPRLIFKGNDYQRACLLTSWENGKIEYNVIRLSKEQKKELLKKNNI